MGALRVSVANAFGFVDCLLIALLVDSCSSAFVGGIRDGLDKRILQPSGHSDVFEAYLALCSIGAVSSLCGPSASLSSRSFHANTNVVIITGDSQNSYPVSRDGGNIRENCQLKSTIGVINNGSSASHRGRNMQVRPHVNSSIGVRSASRRTCRRVLTSGNIADTNFVASPRTSHTYSDLGDCDRRCRYCGASFWGYELPTSNALGAMVFENGISENADFDVIIQHRDSPPQGRTNYTLHIYHSSFHFFSSTESEMVMKLEEELSFLCLLQAFHDTSKRHKCICYKKQITLDNSYVVPYNRDLLLAFRAHINVVYCGWSMLIKYMFKYMSKGRFICAHEAYRRILKFDIHRREPCVQILAVHLEDMQRVTFRDQDRVKSVVDLPGKKSTTLTEWFAFNEANEAGRHLSYLEFPSEFVWYSDRKSWSPWKNNKSSIGRLVYVHPTSGQLFFLRMLLCHQKGCKDFLEVQTINDVFYLTFRAACQALGLLGDDKEWEIAFEEACGSATPKELRFLFSHILLYCDVADPSRLWRKYWKEMIMIYQKKCRKKCKFLIIILMMIRCKAIHYSRHELLFAYGHGGTGKTFLWKTIISSLRSEGKIVLAVASSALDRSLRDIVDKPSSLFGGKSVLLGGDFRQTLPVKKHNMRLARPDINLKECSLVVEVPNCSWYDIGGPENVKRELQEWSTSRNFEYHPQKGFFSMVLLDV
nr:DNA helicase [Tanacetum cinerariifolium]